MLPQTINRSYVVVVPGNPKNITMYLVRKMSVVSLLINYVSGVEHLFSGVLCLHPQCIVLRFIVKLPQLSTITRMFVIDFSVSHVYASQFTLFSFKRLGYYFGSLFLS